jgi:CxxC-x17-CxxC domain-containing protein
MAFTDKTITCADCSQEFVFSVKEQEFYETKGFSNLPKRCTDCRDARKSSRTGDRPDMSGRRQMYPATCAQCKKQTEVPFQPRSDRPVYCSACYSTINVTR